MTRPTSSAPSTRKIGLYQEGDPRHIVEVVLETIKENLEKGREDQARRLRQRRRQAQGCPQGAHPKTGRRSRSRGVGW